MNTLQKLGGMAAIAAATTFVVGFALYFTLLDGEGYGASDTSAEENARFLVDNESVMYAWNFIIYVVFGAALVVLVLALHEQLQDRSTVVMPIATAFGLIWAGLVIASGMVANIGASAVIDLYGSDPVSAGALWRSLDFVANGLGGGNEIVGGIWVLLVSWAAFQTGAFSRVLNSAGIAIGVSGIVTAIPAFEVLGAVFGLGLIVWFIWVGRMLLRASPNAAGRPSAGRAPSLITANDG